MKNCMQMCTHISSHIFPSLDRPDSRAASFSVSLREQIAVLCRRVSHHSVTFACTQALRNTSCTYTLASGLTMLPLSSLEQLWSVLFMYNQTQRKALISRQLDFIFPQSLASDFSRVFVWSASKNLINKCSAHSLFTFFKGCWTSPAAQKWIVCLVMLV